MLLSCLGLGLGLGGWSWFDLCNPSANRYRQSLHLQIERRKDKRERKGRRFVISTIANNKKAILLHCIYAMVVIMYMVLFIATQLLCVFVPHSVGLHCNENHIYVFLFWELHGLSPNFHIYVPVSVTNLYIPRIGPHNFLQQIRQTDPGNI